MTEHSKEGKAKVANTTIIDLMNAGVHFGHKTRRWNPKMKPYIYGVRNGITIFNLTVTMQQLAAACEYLNQLAADGKQILFVGAKRQAQECVRDIAEKLGMPYMCDRWLGGTLTNSKVVMSRVNYMKKLQAQDADGSLDALTKKEAANLRREMGKLQTTLGGIANLKGQPAALVVVDVNHEHIAVSEAARLGIPVVAIVDSNCDPDNIEYVIAGNDDSLRSIKVIMDTLSAAIEDGNAVAGRKQEKAAAQEESKAPEKYDEGAKEDEEK